MAARAGIFCLLHSVSLRGLDNLDNIMYILFIEADQPQGAPIESRK